MLQEQDHRVCHQARGRLMRRVDNPDEVRHNLIVSEFPGCFIGKEFVQERTLGVCGRIAQPISDVIAHVLRGIHRTLRAHLNGVGARGEPTVEIARPLTKLSEVGGWKTEHKQDDLGRNR